MKRSGQVKPSNVIPDRRRTVLRPPSNANQVNAAVLRDNAGRPAHLHSDGIRALRHVDRFMIEQEHAGMRGARFGREIGRKITASMP